MKLSAVLFLLSFAAAFGCGREEEAASARRTPIVETRLRTPKGTTRVKQALSAHTPVPSEGDEPVLRDAPLAAEPTPLRLAARAGVVARGVELADAPSGTVLGEFQGRTEVQVLEERDGWARVRTQIVDGGSIEGWVEHARLADPAAKAAAAKTATTTARSDAPAKPAAGAAKSNAPAKPAAAKSAKPAGNGPDEINLVPIAGTEKKRPATPFTHKAHWDDDSIKCETCHHPVKAKGGAVPSYSCSSSGCHTANECDGSAVAKKNKACPSFEDAFHIQCIDCHKKDGGPTKCAECHAG